MRWTWKGQSGRLKGTRAAWDWRSGEELWEQRKRYLETLASGSKQEVSTRRGVKLLRRRSRNLMRVDIAVRLGVDPKKPTDGEGTAVLLTDREKGQGLLLRRGRRRKRLQDAGGLCRSGDLIEKIQRDGWSLIKAIATPDMMGQSEAW